MAKASIRDRLEKLDRDRRFVDWFVVNRFLETLTLEELETFLSGGGYPDPMPNRPSRLDTMDQKSLRKLWEEDELRFGRRSREESEFYADNGFWPEQRGRLHYFEEDGRLQVEWRSEAPEGERTKSKSQQEGRFATLNITQRGN
jgi:hypothetical protein